MSLSSFSLWPLFLFFLAGLLAIAGVFPLPFGVIPPVMGLGFICAFRFQTGVWPNFDRPAYAWLLALFALSAASSLWSVTPNESLERSLKVFSLLLFTLPLIDLARQMPTDILRRWQMIIPAATVLAGLYPLIELHFNFPIYQFFGGTQPENIVWGSMLNKNVSIFIMMLAPSLLICHRAGASTISLLLITMAVMMITTTESQAAQLGLLVIPIAWGALFIFPVTGIPLALSLASLLIILMPWVSPIAFDMFAADMNQQGSLAEQASVSKRLENWDFISRKIMDNPWNGFGMDATRSITFQSEKIYFPTDTIMHPHNMALQVWIEFGLLGIALLLGFFAFLLRRLMKMPPAERRVPFTTFCVVLSFLMISWSIWASWLLGFVVYLTAITILALRTSSGRATS